MAFKFSPLKSADLASVTAEVALGAAAERAANDGNSIVSKRARGRAAFETDRHGPLYYGRVSGTQSVSLIIPCYNEQDSLPHLFAKLDAAAADLECHGIETEAIIVDDGSVDQSCALLREAIRTRPYLKTIHLARNFGQTAAMAAGLDAARFDVLVPLDADLQNDPSDVLMLLSKLDEGYDVVSGWRRRRNDLLLTRKLPSWAANAIISKISGIRLHDYGCTLKAYRRFVMQGLHLYGEMHRFIPIYAAQRGARVTEIEVHHSPRRYGKTKYGLGRVPNVILDLALAQMLRKFATRPMHLFGKFGLASIGLSLLFFTVMVWFKFWGGKDFVETPLPHLTVMSFLVGCLSILMGLLAEMIMRTYYEASRTATYVVRETCTNKETTNFGGPQSTNRASEPTNPTVQANVQRPATSKEPCANHDGRTNGRQSDD